MVRWFVRRRPSGTAAVLGVTLGSLVLAWFAVLAVDVADLFGLRQRLFVERGADYPHLYYHLADNTHPIEWVQWALLGVGCLVASWTAGALAGEKDLRARALFWFAAFLGFLAIKDAGSPRAVVMRYATEWAGTTAAFLAQLVVFCSIGVAGMVVLVRLWPVVRDDRLGRGLLLAGYGAYGLAAGMSATSSWWYEAAGRWLLDTAFGGRVLEAPVVWEGLGQGFMLMDTLVEESVELVAVGLLVAASVRMGELTTPATAPPRVPVTRPARSTTQRH